MPGKHAGRPDPHEPILLPPPRDLTSEVASVQHLPVPRTPNPCLPEGSDWGWFEYALMLILCLVSGLGGAFIALTLQG